MSLVHQIKNVSISGTDHNRYYLQKVLKCITAFDAPDNITCSNFIRMVKNYCKMCLQQPHTNYKIDEIFTKMECALLAYDRRDDKFVFVSENCKSILGCKELKCFTDVFAEDEKEKFSKLSTATKDNSKSASFCEVLNADPKNTSVAKLVTFSCYPTNNNDKNAGLLLSLASRAERYAKLISNEAHHMMKSQNSPKSIVYQTKEDVNNGKTVLINRDNLSQENFSMIDRYLSALNKPIYNDQFKGSSLSQSLRLSAMRSGEARSKQFKFRLNDGSMVTASTISKYILEDISSSKGEGPHVISYHTLTNNGVPIQNRSKAASQQDLKKEGNLKKRIASTPLINQKDIKTEVKTENLQNTRVRSASCTNEAPNNYSNRQLMIRKRSSIEVAKDVLKSTGATDDQTRQKLLTSVLKAPPHLSGKQVHLVGLFNTNNNQKTASSQQLRQRNKSAGPSFFKQQNSNDPAAKISTNQMQPQNSSSVTSQRHNSGPQQSLVQSSPNLFESSLTSPSRGESSKDSKAVANDNAVDRLTKEASDQMVGGSKESVTSHFHTNDWSKEEKEELCDIWASFGLFEPNNPENGASNRPNEEQNDKAQNLASQQNNIQPQNFQLFNSTAASQMPKMVANQLVPNGQPVKMQQAVKPDLNGCPNVVVLDNGYVSSLNHQIHTNPGLQQQVVSQSQDRVYPVSSQSQSSVFGSHIEEGLEPLIDLGSHPPPSGINPRMQIPLPNYPANNNQGRIQIMNNNSYQLQNFVDNRNPRNCNTMQQISGDLNSNQPIVWQQGDHVIHTSANHMPRQVMSMPPQYNTRYPEQFPQPRQHVRLPDGNYMIQNPPHIQFNGQQSAVQKSLYNQVAPQMRFKPPLQSQLSDPMMYATNRRQNFPAQMQLQQEELSKPKKRKPAGGGRGSGGGGKRRRSQQQQKTPMTSAPVSWQQLINSDQQQQPITSKMQQQQPITSKMQQSPLLSASPSSQLQINSSAGGNWQGMNSPVASITKNSDIFQPTAMGSSLSQNNDFLSTSQIGELMGDDSLTSNNILAGFDDISQPSPLHLNKSQNNKLVDDLFVTPHDTNQSASSTSQPLIKGESPQLVDPPTPNSNRNNNKLTASRDSSAKQLGDFPEMGSGGENGGGETSKLQQPLSLLETLLLKKD